MITPEQFLTRPPSVEVTPAARFVMTHVAGDSLESIWISHRAAIGPIVNHFAGERCAHIMSFPGHWLAVLDTLLPSGERLYTICVDTESSVVKARHITAALRYQPGDDPYKGA